VLCIRNTIRKVTMVVPVLMTSCQVSLNRKSGPVAIQMNTIPVARKKAIGLPASRLVVLAKRVNQDRDLVGCMEGSGKGES
jgi:hypothetical protein